MYLKFMNKFARINTLTISFATVKDRIPAKRPVFSGIRDMKYIKLTKGKRTMVDNDDFEKLNKLRWCISSEGYALRVEDGKSVSMHRSIMGVRGVSWKGIVVDHINGKKLDNRKENLRLCTVNENVRNANIRSDNTSGYKGVSWSKAMGKWYTHICFNGKIQHLGYFSEKVEAGLAYNKKAIELFADFAKLNIINDKEK